MRLPEVGVYPERIVMIGNLIGVAFLVITTAAAFMTSQPEPETTAITPWNDQPGTTNKLKSNGNRDISMVTELARRRAIATVHRYGYRPIRETKLTSGAVNGHLEAYILTGVCPLGTAIELIMDGEAAANENCAVYDGETNSGREYDGGNAQTLVCGT